MSVTQPPPLDSPDAGVIEEARARQRRQRGLAGAATIAAVTIAALLFAFGGGGNGLRGRVAPLPAGAPSANGARSSSASCLSRGKALEGPPSKSLLSILGVLRRPATAADSLGKQLVARGLTRDVFVNYVRRTQVVGESPYYVFPAIIGGCGVESEREGIADLETNINLGGGTIGGRGGGGYTAADIEQAKTAGTGPPGSATSTTITMIVPDGVASVTLHYPAGRASGYRPRISPPFTITRRVLNNELVVTVPRSGGPESISGIRMTWRAANGHVVRTFKRL